MTVDQALVDQLLPYVRNSGFAFELLCARARCYRKDTISAARHTLRTERARRKACEKLVAQGWRVIKRPLCPSCARSDLPEAPEL